MTYERRLTRSTSDQIIAGVCGGLARWVGWDPTLVRVVYLLATIFLLGLPGVVLYVLLWIVMPLEASV